MNHIQITPPFGCSELFDSANCFELLCCDRVRHIVPSGPCGFNGSELFFHGDCLARLGIVLGIKFSDFYSPALFITIVAVNQAYLEQVPVIFRNLGVRHQVHELPLWKWKTPSYQALGRELITGSRGSALRNQVDVQNSFCIYIWHPVQESRWFLGYAFGYAIGDALVDGIGDAVVYPSVDAGGIRQWTRACTES
jgi:hypothetical protein